MEYFFFDLWIERTSEAKFKAIIDDFLDDVHRFMNNEEFGGTAYCDYYKHGERAFQIGLEFRQDCFAVGLARTVRYIYDEYPDITWRIELIHWDGAIEPPEN